MVPFRWKPTRKQKISQIKNVYKQRQTNGKRVKTTTNWQNNLSTIIVAFRLNLTFWAQMDPLGWNNTPKYLGHRWSHSGEKVIPEYLGHSWSHLGRKLALNISGTDGPTKVKIDKEAKQNKSNKKNVYRQKQTNGKRRKTTTNWQNNLSTIIVASR